MSLHTRAEFAVIIGKSRAWVTTYVSRGKIVLNSDKLIDDKTKENKELMDHWVSFHKDFPSKIHVDKRKQKRKPKKSKSIKVEGDEPEPEKKEVDESYPDEKISIKSGDSLQIRKLKSEILYKISQVEKQNLASAQIRGESLPTEMVGAIISTLGSSFQSEYKNGAESLMMQFTHENKLPPDVIAGLKGDLIVLINKVHDNAIRLAQKELKNLISKSIKK